MALIDDYDALADDLQSHHRCGFADVRDSMSPDEWDELMDLMNDPTRKHSIISRVLVARGFSVARMSVGRHRQGGWPGECLSCRRLESS